MSSEKDKLIDELIEIARQKKAEIEKTEKPTWKTNCLFGTEASSVKTNIRTVSSAGELVKIASQIISREKDHAEANKLLGTSEEFEYSGFSKQDWIDDLKTRVDQINLSQKKKDLELIEKKLDGMISKERREELELAAITKALKG